MKSIFIIEQGWIDPLENRNAHGYTLFGYALNEQAAKDFCDSKGFWTREDCWSIRGRMAKFRYKELKRRIQ
jgi:hypothetical protein